MARWLAWWVLAVAWIGSLSSIHALPPGFAQTDIGGSWNQVAGLAFSQDGSRLFVVERGGTVWIVEGGVTLPQPFLDISATAQCSHRFPGGRQLVHVGAKHHIRSAGDDHGRRARTWRPDLHLARRAGAQ